MEELGEKYQNLSLVTKILLLLVCAAGLGYMQYNDVYIPSLSGIENAKVEDEKLASDVANLNKAGQSAASVEAAFRKAEEDLFTLLLSLPAEGEIEKILASFADSARESGVEIKAFVPEEESVTSGGASATSASQPPPVNVVAPVGAPVPAPGTNPMAQEAPEYFLIPVTLKASGTFSQLMTFYDKILSLQRIIRLEDLSLKKETASSQGAGKMETPASSGQSPKLTSEARLMAFRQKGFTYSRASEQGSSAVSGSVPTSVLSPEAAPPSGISPDKKTDLPAGEVSKESPAPSLPVKSDNGQGK